VPNPEDIIKYINYIFHLIFGTNTPYWLLMLAAWGLGISILLCSLLGILTIISKIKETWVQSFQPLFYNPDEKQRGRRRQHIAGRIEHEIGTLNEQEWIDDLFTDLEAEIKTEGRRRKRGNSGPRYEKSLSKAIVSSIEPIILLEGEPGSGKSVALRHVAQKMAERAKKTRSTKSIIPIYVNLKLLKREAGEKINQELIQSFILRSLHRGDRRKEKFLDEEFEAGIENGTWFFLFDSFDELPEVLSSTEADDKIKEYRQAIDDFLRGGKGRGVVASRPYRSPNDFRWPCFRVLPLTEARQQELVHKSSLHPKFQHEVIGKLGNAKKAIRSMASNPFYLTLLYKHMEQGHPFPENAYTIFATYMQEIFTKDEMRLQQLFQLNAAQVRTAAENIAFCMTASLNLGLSPTRISLRAAIGNLGIDLGGDFETFLEALEYMRLARPDTTTNAAQSRSFTFSHRRFQEYFATCAVLREPSLVGPHQLLTDERWRETTVVVCQTGLLTIIKPILQETYQLLMEYTSSISDDFLIPVSFNFSDQTDIVVRDVHSVDDTKHVLAATFPWPTKLLHVLGLLQDGLADRLQDIPPLISQSIGRLLASATQKGILLDKKWALEVAGTIPIPILENMIEDAFSSKSQWLREAAYRQVARLDYISPDVAQGIRNALLELFTSNRLRREEYATRAHLARLQQPPMQQPPMQQPPNFLSTLQLLLWLPRIDRIFHILLWFLFLFELLSMKSGLSSSIQFILLFVAATSFFISHLVLRKLEGPPLYNMKVDKNGSKRRSLFPLDPPSWMTNIPLDSMSLRLLLIGVPFLYLYFPSFFSLSNLFAWANLLRSLPSPSSLFDQTSRLLFQQLAPTLLSQPLGICFTYVTSVYIAFFGPAAFGAARTGWFVRFRMWPFLPIAPFFYGLNELKHRKTLVKFLVQVILGIGLIGIWPLLYITWKFAQENKTPTGIIMIVAGLSLIVGVICWAGWILLYLRDWQKLQQWQKVDPKSITSHHKLIGLVVSYYHESFCIRFIKTIRKQAMPAMSLSETETLLTQVILDIEEEKRRSKQKAMNRQVTYADIACPIDCTTAYRYKSFLAKADADVLDELNQWLENIRDQKPLTTP
jgi:NACHT domain